MLAELNATKNQNNSHVPLRLDIVTIRQTFTINMSEKSVKEQTCVLNSSQLHYKTVTTLKYVFKSKFSFLAPSLPPSAHNCEV